MKSLKHLQQFAITLGLLIVLTSAYVKEPTCDDRDVILQSAELTITK